MPKVLPINPAKPASANPQPPALHDRAMDNLEFIRSTMEQAGAFTAVSGWAMFISGLIGIAAALISTRQPTPDRWLYVWLVAGAAAMITQLWAMLAKVRRSNMPLLSGPGRKFILAVSPPLFVGAALTYVLYNAGVVELIPGVWLLLYGTAVIAGGTFSIEIVPLMGLCFLIAGTLALVTPVSWNDWILAAGFGGFHILFGIPIARRHGG